MRLRPRFHCQPPPSSTSPSEGDVTRRRRLSRALRSIAWTPSSRGSLRLSSFARFAQHEDEQRKDESEGETSFIERSARGENRTIAFANAVSRHVPGFIHRAEGLCIYTESPGILREAETGLPFAIEVHDGELSYDPAALRRLRDHIAERAGLVPLFLKNARYACQAEYRLLWLHHGMAAASRRVHR